MACATCKKPSHYIYRITLDKGIEYCNACLPKFLVARKKAGLLETTDEYKSAIEEGLKNIAKKEETVVPVIEEPKEEIEEVVEEKPKPKKKATKKKAE